MKVRAGENILSGPLGSMPAQAEDRLRQADKGGDLQPSQREVAPHQLLVDGHERGLYHHDAGKKCCGISRTDRIQAGEHRGEPSRSSP